ncbi:MAG: hypothetical protein GX829_03200 [Clostridium sp.]|jgi:hypothetical protein|nr:hypothetical protein [Clostridium sp.]
MQATITEEILQEAYELKETFSISYRFGIHKESLYSTTYDELSKWLKKTIRHFKATSPLEKDDPFVIYLNSFRGKMGNIDRKEFELIINQLEERFQVKKD